MEERTAGPYLVSTFFMSVITVLDGIAHAPKQQGMPVIIGYAIAPLIVTAIIAVIAFFIRRRNLRSAAKTAFWTLLIWFLSSCFVPIPQR
jgi:hypothetical protein